MAKKRTKPATIEDQLRQAVRDSGLTHYALSKAAGVTPDMIDQFMSGRDIRLTTAAKLAAVLSLELRPVAAE